MVNHLLIATLIEVSSYTMHRALYISEIVNMVCEPLDEVALASLARSCKALHEPALRSLWADLSNLTPLVKCFPADTWCVEENELVSARIYS